MLTTSVFYSLKSAIILSYNFVVALHEFYIFIAVFHGHYLDGGFTMPFYKQMLSKSYELEDLESIDPELHRSLGWML